MECFAPICIQILQIMQDLMRIIASAQARQIPVISAKQLLTWLDGRNNSFFSNINWSKNQLSFKIIAQKGAKNLRAMLPLYAETGQLVSVKMNGDPVSLYYPNY